MSNVIVNHGPAERNGKPQIDQDQATVLLSKLSVLLEIGLNSDLQLLTTASLHIYLWMLSDLVEELEVVIG